MDASVFRYKEAFYTAQLRGIMDDICQVYALISQSGQRFPNDENVIRDRLCSNLQNDTYKNTSTSYVRYYHVDTEVREGTHGRSDIRFLQVSPYIGQEVYYTIECKRLNGKNRLCKEYVNNGIRRFTTGKYRIQLGCNAMIGFVVCAINLGKTVDKINSYLAANEHLQTQCTVMSPMVKLETRHGTPTRFILYHLWLDFSDLIDLTTSGKTHL